MHQHVYDKFHFSFFLARRGGKKTFFPHCSGRQASQIYGRENRFLSRLNEKQKGLLNNSIFDLFPSCDIFSLQQF